MRPNTPPDHLAAYDHCHGRGRPPALVVRAMPSGHLQRDWRTRANYCSCSIRRQERTLKGPLLLLLFANVTGA